MFVLKGLNYSTELPGIFKKEKFLLISCKLFLTFCMVSFYLSRDMKIENCLIH